MSTPVITPPRGNYFTERDYLKTDVRRGVTRNRAGTRILTLTSDFLIGLRNALVFECGKAADAVLKTAGRRWGKNFAARIEKELGGFYGMPVAEFPLALFEASLVMGFSHHGFGKLRLDVSLYDKGLIVAVVENPIYFGLLDSAAAPADPLLTGIFAGLFSHFAGRELDCVQTQCQVCGAADSRFVVSLASRLAGVDDWLKEGKNHTEVLALLAQTRVNEP
jgi:predicted hydrocarbon binding protein